VTNEFRVRIEMPSLSKETLDRLEDILSASPGQTPVAFELCSPDGYVAFFKAQQGVNVTPQLVEFVRGIFGDRSVEVAGE
jgi:hypothetical protein